MPTPLLAFDWPLLLCNVSAEACTPHTLCSIHTVRRQLHRFVRRKCPGPMTHTQPVPRSDMAGSLGRFPNVTIHDNTIIHIAAKSNHVTFLTLSRIYDWIDRVTVWHLALFALYSPRHRPYDDFNLTFLTNCCYLLCQCKV
jgi:hypothetical protein